MQNASPPSPLPPPLTPPDCDLRGFDWMPLYGGPYFSSSSYFQALAHNPRAGLAAIRLWWHAWHQIPAASLPNNDTELALMADFGTDVAAWAACRDIALRGFVLCSDNRLYHKTLSVIAAEKFILRQRMASKRKKANERLKNWRSAKNHEQDSPETERKTQAEAALHEQVPARSGAETEAPGKESGAAGTRNVDETRFISAQDTLSSCVESERERKSESESETDLLGQIVPQRFTLPPDVPKNAWNDYVEMRKRIRKTMTPRAKHLAVLKLKSLAEQGYDMEAVLEQSVLRSYTGLFPTRNDETEMKCVSKRTSETSSSSISQSFARLKEKHKP